MVQSEDKAITSSLNPTAATIVPPGATIIGNTIIPPTETTSTRPTDTDGIAYPFKLKGVSGEEVRSGNASMVTLMSEKRPESAVGGGKASVDGLSMAGTPALETPRGEGAPILERPPAPERFETARETL